VQQAMYRKNRSLLNTKDPHGPVIAIYGLMAIGFGIGGIGYIFTAPDIGGMHVQIEFMFRDIGTQALEEKYGEMDAGIMKAERRAKRMTEGDNLKTLMVCAIFFSFAI
jgi:hypothetical protein